MTRVQTYVFIDLETTDLPKEDCDGSRITALNMIAVNRQHLVDPNLHIVKPTTDDYDPMVGSDDAIMTLRVQDKLFLCFNPPQKISDGCTADTVHDKILPKDKLDFNEQVFTIIDTFLSILSQPVCLIAKNGIKFSILKNHLSKLKKNFTADVLCADSLAVDPHNISKKRKLEHEERNGLEIPPTSNSVFSASDETDVHTSNISMQAVNETTPTRTLSGVNEAPEFRRTAKRKLDFPCDDALGAKSDLKELAIGVHQVETVCMIALSKALSRSQKFVEWIDGEKKKFADE